MYNRLENLKKKIKEPLKTKPSKLMLTAPAKEIPIKTSFGQSPVPVPFELPRCQDCKSKVLFLCYVCCKCGCKPASAIDFDATVKGPSGDDKVSVKSKGYCRKCCLCVKCQEECQPNCLCGCASYSE